MRRRCSALVFAYLSAGAAHAQVSGSVALVSDYLYRGISLSGGKPAPQMTLAYDADSGWYAGLFASRLGRADAGGSAQAIIYAGYARRLASGLSWESGWSQYSFRDDGARNYREVQLGLSGERFSARLSYAPDYMGMHARTVYIQASATHSLGDTLSLFAHTGYLNYLPGSPPALPRYRADARLGIVKSVGDWKIQLAWDGVHVGPAPEPVYGVYGATYPASRRGFLLELRRSF